jgi:hypothetical protein
MQLVMRLEMGAWVIDTRPLPDQHIVLNPPSLRLTGGPYTGAAVSVIHIYNPDGGSAVFQADAVTLRSLADKFSGLDAHAERLAKAKT